MKHLAIYFIATSNYQNGFTFFKENLNTFFPNFRKTVIILSDGLTEWNNVEEDNITYKVYHIDHFCWPIITLFKMKYILDYRIDCDYVCYCNANLQFNIHYNYDNDTIFDLTKLNVSHHACAYNNDMFDGYIFCENKMSPTYKEFVKESETYIDHPYKYVHAAFFMGPSDIVYKMCNDIATSVEIDLRKNIIPLYHDETYLNKWVDTHPDLIHRGKFLSNGYFDDNIPFSLVQSFIKNRESIIER
jgi:hypothetical protein